MNDDLISTLEWLIFNAEENEFKTLPDGDNICPSCLWLEKRHNDRGCRWLNKIEKAKEILKQLKEQDGKQEN